MSEADAPDGLCASSMFLSSTVNVVEFTVVVDPLTVRSAETVKDPSTCTPPVPFALNTKSSFDLIVVISFSNNLTPDVLTCPVVVKFSLPNEIAPDVSVNDPFAIVMFPPVTEVPAVIVVVPAIAPVTSKGTAGSLSIPTLSFVVSKCNKFVEPVELNFMSVVTRASSADNIPPVILPNAIMFLLLYFVDSIKGLRTFY